MSDQPIELIDQSPIKQLTDWANPPKLKELKTDLTNSKSAHDGQSSKLQVWSDYMQGTGVAGVKTQQNQSKVVPKLIRKQAEWRYAALSEPFLSTPDLFKIDPTTWEDKKGAEQNELLLNNQFATRINRVAFIDEYVRAAVDEGTVFIRTGWDYQDEQVTTLKPVYEYVLNPQMGQVYQQLQQLEQTDPVQILSYPQEVQDGYDTFKQTGVPYQLFVTDYEEVEETKVLKNCPTVEICKQDNVYVDPSCQGDLQKANFIIYSFETSLAELKAEGRYSNLERIDVSKVTPLTAPEHKASNISNFQPEGKPRQRIVAYEYWGYWDTDNSGVVRPIVATWVGDILIRMEENPFPDGELPFVAVQYLPVRKSVYGEPDAELLKDNQDILGAVTRGCIDLMGKSANSQTGFAKNMLDATNKKRYSTGQDYEYNPGTDPRQGIYTHTFPEIPQSAQFMIGMMNNEAESLTGVKAFSGANGISGQGLGQTAAGVRGALDAASKREMGILRRMSDGLVKVGRKIIAMNAVWLDEQEVVRVTEDTFVPIRRDDLPGNYDLKLTISTAEADEAKAQELAFMLQTMGQTMDPELTKMVLSEIARLRKMPDIARQIKQFQPQPDPVQQQMQQLQMQLLQAQINLTNAQAAEAGSKSAVNQVKTGTEAARTNQIQANADKANLDFLQTQNGTKHQQAVEMQQVKEDGNLTTQALQNENELERLRLNHKSELLKTHAQTDLNHRSQLQLLKASTDLKPQSSRSSQ